MIGWTRCSFHKKHAGTCDAKLVLLHPWGSAGHIVHSGHELSMHYFSCLGGTGTDSRKSAMRHVIPNLCFCIRWDMQVMLCIPVHPGCKMSTRYFSCSRGTDTDSRNSALRHVTSNLCFCIRCDLWVMWCIPVRLWRETSTYIFHTRIGPI
jgi:hypothetical protein